MILWLIAVLFPTTGQHAAAQPISIHNTDPVIEYLRLMQIRGQLETDASLLLQPLRYEWLNKTDDSEIRHAHPWKSRTAPLLQTGSKITGYRITSRKRSSLETTELNKTGPGNINHVQTRVPFYRHPLEWHFYSPRFYQSYNSRFPSGMNDGALWQGRGYNTSLALGAVVRWRFLEAALRPEFGYSQNSDFDLSPFPVRSDLSEYSYPFRRIVDLPQRFGDQPLQWSDWGNSYLKLIAGPVAMAWSNEHHWFGPAWFNPIIMSNNAPGFRHIYLETHRPLQTRAGTFESRIYWGALHESDYFYVDRDTPKRYLTGLMVAWSPSFIENVSLAAVRTFYEYWPEGGLSLQDITRIYEPFYKIEFVSDDNPSGSDEASQMFSLMLRWFFPSYGSEVYAEFARNDHALDYRDLVMEPEHATAFTLGAIKSSDLGSRRFLTYHFELTQIEGRKTMLYRGGYYRMGHYYTDNIVRQGYTQQGQVLGAGIGPGSGSQYFGVTLYDRWGRAGLFLRRVVNDNDNLLENLGMIRSEQGFPGAQSMRAFHDVEMQTGFNATLFYRGSEMSILFYRTYQYNRYYIRNDDAIWYHISLMLRHPLSGSLR